MNSKVLKLLLLFASEDDSPAAKPYVAACDFAGWVAVQYDYVLSELPENERDQEGRQITAVYEFGGYISQFYKPKHFTLWEYCLEQATGWGVQKEKCSRFLFLS